MNLTHSTVLNTNNMKIKRRKRVKNNMLPNIRIGNINLTNFKVFNHHFDVHAKQLGNETSSAHEAYICSIQGREGS